MDWQEATALLIVSATVVAFAWARLRGRRFQFVRDAHCGCASSARGDAQGSIVYRVRKGERPQVIVKMK